MFNILLYHWATYVFLAWVVVIVVANFWLRMRTPAPSKTACYVPNNAKSDFQASSVSETVRSTSGTERGEHSWSVFVKK